MIDYPAPDLNLLSGTISIGTATIAFLIYYFVFSSEQINTKLRDKFGKEEASVRKVLYNRLLGGILYGVIPFLIIIFVFRRPLSHYGFSGDYVMKSFLWWIPVASLVVLLTYLGAKSEKNLEMYPQIRVQEWNRGLLIVSALSWITYLFGFLLCYLTLYLGSFWFAIFIHITMALSNEWFSLGFQPQMKLINNDYNK